MLTTVAGHSLSLETCARRLVPYGVRPASGSGPDRLLLEWPEAEGGDVACDISWWGPGRGGAPGSESLVQAASGLMHLHGRDAGGPRLVGIEVCSVAAGLLAAQALLAAAIGHSRGVPLAGVRTSVLQAGLHQAAHHLAAATCPPEEMPAPLPAPGPPFHTADDRWFEIETFDTEAWKAFWLHLGAPPDQLGAAWGRFRPRYYRGTASLPPGFHEATVSRTLAEVAAVARACRVSLSPVRGYDEVRAGAGPSDGLPVVTPFAGTGGHEPRPVPRAPAGALPLAGLEVVEATSRMQGPLAGLLLQMLGARVTRVEPPGGDVGRSVPPFAGETGSFFLCFNRGKQTVELDLGRPAGRAELEERVRGADVFLHNWRPGKASDWDLGADDLARANPGLVYVEASGWAPGSEAGHLIGTDFLVQAWTGLANTLHPEPDPPHPSRVLLVDFMGALVTAEGALGGLYHREVRGTGCKVETSLEAGAMALQAHVMDDARPPATGTLRRHGRPVWGALDVPVEASDGWLVVDVDGAGLQRLSGTCGIASSGRSPAELEEEAAKHIAGGTMAEWVERLAACGVTAQPVASDLAALPADPMLAPLFEPLGGGCRAPAVPWLLEP